MNKKGIMVSRKLFTGIALGYLAVPVLIFFMGFLKIWIGLICSAVLVTMCVLAVKDSKKDREGQLNNSGSLLVPFSFLAIAVVAAVLISVATGVGEYVWTTYDHAFRRAMLRDLVDYSWPVIYSPSTQSNPDVMNLIHMNSNALYVYYLCYWLPAALFGKAFGFAAANVFLVVWNSIGIVILLIGMSMFAKRTTLSALLILVLFSGLDGVMYIIYEITEYSDWWWFEGYVTNISLISNINSFLNVYNQCIPCWIITLLIMLAINNRSLGLYGGLLFAYTPWGTIGLVPIAIAKLLSKDMRAKETSRQIRNVFALTNLVPAALMLAVFGSYYLTSESQSVSGFTITFFDTPWHFIWSYLVLVAIEIVPFVVILYKDNKKKPLFWAAVITPVVLPMYKITEQNDFVMRGAMASLFIICVLLVYKVTRIVDEDERNKVTKEKRSKKETLKVFGLSVVLVAMCYTTYFMGNVVFAMTVSGGERPDNAIVSFGNIATTEYAEIIEDQFFAYSYSEKPFYKYLARK